MFVCLPQWSTSFSKEKGGGSGNACAVGHCRHSGQVLNDWMNEEVNVHA